MYQPTPMKIGDRHGSSRWYLAPTRVSHPQKEKSLPSFKHTFSGAYIMAVFFREGLINSNQATRAQLVACSCCTPTTPDPTCGILFHCRMLSPQKCRPFCDLHCLRKPCGRLHRSAVDDSVRSLELPLRQ